MKKLLILFCIKLIVISASCTSMNRYPDHWWQPVNDSSHPDWEILPQAANRNNNEVILSKRNELGILSNFAATSFILKGKKYASIEGFWQSLKFPEDDKDERFVLFQNVLFKRNDVEQMTAFTALKAGKEANEIMKKNGINWVSFEKQKIEYKGNDIETHYKIIEAATRAKIDQNPEVKKILLSTGDLKLKPDHLEDKDGTKSWKYYEIYMKLRSELKNNPEKRLLPNNWE